MKSYKRLSLVEREEISRKLILGLSFRQIGKELSRSASTICRELKGYNRSTYRAHLSQRRSFKRSRSRKYRKRKLIFNQQLLKVVREKLNEYWSPRQVASYLKLHYKRKSMQVSAETIYSYIYIFLRRSLREEFTNQLRRGHKKRRTQGRSAKGQKSDLKDMVSIDERPAEVDDRIVPGHWEGDIMIGGARAQTALGTLVERRTRFAILVPLKSKKSEDVRKAFAKEINKLPKELRLSLTYDQGREMAQHKKLTESTDMKVYFAHPKSPWERGTNENTNGLLRQYFPKATDFRALTRKEIKKVQRSLNGRPRETLGWKTPHEVMRDLLR